MPSRAEMRVRVEHALRGIVIVVLAVMLWQSLHQQVDSGGRSVSARGIGHSLAAWSTLAKAPAGIHVQLDSVPTPIERAWLGALAGSGSSVTWSGDLAPVMIEAQPVASPSGGTKILVAAPSGSSLVISDDVGVIDTVRAQNAGAALVLGSAPDQIIVRTKASAASTARMDSVALRRVLVIGEAGWESKFVIAALEEEGWKVDAFIRLAPGVDVTQGPAAVIDTSRYSAMVALDGTAAPYANRIIEFARTGGGVVLAPGAAALDAMAPLRAGGVSRAASDARAMQLSGSVTLATLAFAPITSLRSDAVSLEKRTGATAVAVRRIGGGRVLQLGYEDTWRWRMGGGDGAIQDHRRWWTGLVGGVAYSTRIPVSATARTDEAPMIGLLAGVLPSTLAGFVSTHRGKPAALIAGLCVLLALSLVVEVASRRHRGAP